MGLGPGAGTHTLDLRSKSHMATGSSTLTNGRMEVRDLTIKTVLE